MRNNPVISIVLGLILAAVAGFLVFYIIQSQAPTVPVVVAVRNIDVGEAITEENIDVQNFPASMVPIDTLREEAEAIGMRVSYGPVLKGAMLFKENINSQGTLKTQLMAYAPVYEKPGEVLELFPGEWAALEIPSENGIRGLRQGDFIDILGERPLTSGSVDVAVVVPHAMILEVPSDKYPRYTLAVERKYLEAAAEITVRKMNVVIAMSSTQPVISARSIEESRSESPLLDENSVE